MIWITSDLHLNHDRPFIYQARGFDSVYDMNDTIIRNWNSVVSPDDDVYVLGDLMLNNNDAIKIIKNLKGNIHIILGNHDTDERVRLYNSCWNVVEICYATVIKYNGYHFYLSHYPTICSNHDDDKPLRKRMINLCGHTHTTDRFIDMDKGLIYHVELDAHDMKLVSIDEIIKDLESY